MFKAHIITLIVLTLACALNSQAQASKAISTEELFETCRSDLEKQAFIGSACHFFIEGYLEGHFVGTATILSKLGKGEQDRLIGYSEVCLADENSFQNIAKSFVAEMSSFDNKEALQQDAYVIFRSFLKNKYPCQQ